jgi:hypothetical protein
MKILTWYVSFVYNRKLSNIKDTIAFYKDISILENYLEGEKRRKRRSIHMPAYTKFEGDFLYWINY